VNSHAPYRTQWGNDEVCVPDGCYCLEHDGHQFQYVAVGKTQDDVAQGLADLLRKEGYKVWSWSRSKLSVHGGTGILAPWAQIYFSAQHKIRPMSAIEIMQDAQCEGT